MNQRTYGAKKNDSKSGVKPPSSPKTAVQPISSPRAPLLQLQRQLGNAAVQRMYEAGALQAKLRIGEPNDAYEQEADRVANQVMRMPEDSAFSGQLSAVGKRGESIQMKPGCSRSDPTCGEEEEDIIRTKPGSGNALETTADADAIGKAVGGGGRPLSEPERNYFEPRFGRDFSGVRVHSDTESAGLANSINARAFTIGREIVFGEGQYSPDTHEGRRLLAHELTHVAQQSERNEPMLNMKTYQGTANRIVNLIRDTWKVDPGNRHEEIIMSNGRSFAGVSLLFLLYNNDATGGWLDETNIKKRATLSYDVKAANCDEYADMAYCQGRTENTGAMVSIERQPGHAYAVMYNSEDRNNRPNHTIIDPWVKRAHLRKDNDYYMRPGSSDYNETRSDGRGWYMRGYYARQLSRYNMNEINAYYGRNAQVGRDLAERKKKGEHIEHMY